MTINQAFYDLKEKLQKVYDPQESAAMAHEVLFSLTGMDKMQRLIRKDSILDEPQANLLNRYTEQLLRGVPLQYVLGVAWFMERPFTVTPAVLIPRPETEELVDWIITDYKNAQQPFSVLDIGSGSGCIPVSVQLALPKALVSSVDISVNALTVAKKNAADLSATVDFIELDFLNKTLWNGLGTFDIIVSNPPYIPETDKASMHANVKDHEPAIALFVPDEDPLLFYKAIADFGRTHLNKHSAVYCELHLEYAQATQKMFEEKGYATTELRKDMHGNWRMLKAVF